MKYKVEPVKVITAKQMCKRDLAVIKTPNGEFIIPTIEGILSLGCKINELNEQEYA